MDFVLRLNSLFNRSMIFVVLNEILSFSGKLKKDKQASIDFSKQLTAEGIFFSHLLLNVSKDSSAVPFEEA